MMSRKKPPTYNIHNCLKGILMLAQVLGAFPINNILSTDPEQMEFKFGSWKMVLTCLVVVGYMTCGLTAFHKALSFGTLINQLISPLFYVNLVVITVIFVQIARKWKEFTVKVCKVEELLSRRYPCSFDLRRKVNVIAVICMVLALFEHGLSTLNFIYSNTCQNYSSGWEYYFRKQFHYIFFYFPYHIVGGLVLMVLSWMGTFTWNLGDTLIILISIVMSTRFKQISHSLRLEMRKLRKSKSDLPQLTEGKFMKVYYSSGISNQSFDVRFWRQLREDYDKVSGLCKYLDCILSNLIMFSYAYNLSFILIQLFNSLRQMDSFIERLYFFFSFGFVISRTVAVSVYGASIYDESRAFIPILNSVPTELYNVEIQRLIIQIQVDSAALTGHNFFRLTRGLVLNVAAAIITYELVLIQFNQATLEKIMSTNATICY